jgi:hypothetical protein
MKLVKHKTSTALKKRECVLRKGQLHEPDKINIGDGNYFFVAVRPGMYGRWDNAQKWRISKHGRCGRGPAL